MKNLITIMIVILATSQVLFASEPQTSLNSASKEITFIIDLHTPRSNCTNYLGICKIGICIEFNFEDGSLGSGEIPCNITLGRKNELIIQLTESNISKFDPDLLKFLNGKTSVTIDDTYDITDELSKDLQLQGRVVIRQGTYGFTCQNGIYTFTFPQ